MNGQQRTSLEFLEAFLREHFPRDVIIPCLAGAKSPMFAHAHHAWTWERYDRFRLQRQQDAGRMRWRSPHVTHDVAVVLHDICVVDADGSERVREFEELLGPRISGIPVVETARGRHYWFRRPAKADAYGYFDGAGQRVKGLDFKSVSRTGTGGIVCVPPSEGKRWRGGALPPCDPRQLRDIPDDVLDHVAIRTYRTPTDTMLPMTFADGSSDVLPASHHVQTMAYFEPFFSAEVDDAVSIPVPCTRPLFLLLLEFLETKKIPCDVPSSKDLRLELARAARILGVLRQESVVRELARGLQMYRDGVAAAFPEWWVAEREMRRGAPLTEVSEEVVYRPVTNFRTRRLFEHTCRGVESGRISRRPHGLHPGDTVVVPPSGDRAAWRAEVRVDPVVLDALRMFPGRLVLAGGAALAAVAPSLPASNDYDLFLVDGGAPGDVVEALRDLFSREEGERSKKGHRPSVTGNAITFVVHREEQHPVLVQLIVRRFPSVRDVLSSFDITPCKVALFWGEEERWRAVCAPSWIPSMARMAFPLDLERWSTSSVYRTFKYFAKGFEVYIPGCRREALSLLEGRWKSTSTTRLCELLRVERTLTPLSCDRWPDMCCLSRELRRAGISDYEARVDDAKSMAYVVKSMVRSGYLWITRPFRRTMVRREEARTEDVRNEDDKLRGISWPVYDPACPVMHPAAHGWEDVVAAEDEESGGSGIKRGRRSSSSSFGLIP